MAFLTSLLWLVAMLAAVAHAAKADVRWRDLLWLASGFVAAAGLAQLIGAINGVTGVVVGVTAAWRLATGGSHRHYMMFAGLCAGFAASSYTASSVDMWIAATLSLGVLAAGMLFARGQGSGVERTREAVLMLVAFAGPVIAAAPEIAAGWQSAQALSQPGEADAARAIPLWAFGFVALALLAGALRGYWARK